MFRFEKVAKFADVDFDMPIRKTTDSACYDMVAAEDAIILPYGMLSDIMNFSIESERLTPEVKKLIDQFAETDPNQAQNILNKAITYTLDEMADLTKKIGAKPSLVSTGVKAYMPHGYSLDLYVRSSCPLKYWITMANGTGIIDADYADNDGNEGEIFFQLINFSPAVIKIKKGDIIGQGKFVKYEVTEDDHLSDKAIREGGFGSTSIDGSAIV